MRAARGLANGTPGIADSLCFHCGVVPDAVLEAWRANTYAELEIAPPLSVNVRVGGDVDDEGNVEPCSWHGIDLNVAYEVERVAVGAVERGVPVVPVTCRANKREVKLYSLCAAQMGAPDSLRVRTHSCMPAFAMTDYGAQGRTFDRIIMSICERPRVSPAMSMSSLYVIVSRPRTGDGLRVLQHDGRAFERLKTMRHDEYVCAWDDAYNEQGDWEDERAIAALERVRALRQPGGANAGA